MQLQADEVDEDGKQLLAITRKEFIGQLLEKNQGVAALSFLRQQEEQKKGQKACEKAQKLLQDDLLLSLQDLLKKKESDDVVGRSIQELLPDAHRATRKDFQIVRREVEKYASHLFDEWLQQVESENVLQAVKKELYQAKKIVTGQFESGDKDFQELIEVDVALVKNNEALNHRQVERSVLETKIAHFLALDAHSPIQWYPQDKLELPAKWPELHDMQASALDSYRHPDEAKLGKLAYVKECYQNVHEQEKEWKKTIQKLVGKTTLKYETAKDALVRGGIAFKDYLKELNEWQCTELDMKQVHALYSHHSATLICAAGASQETNITHIAKQ